MITAINSQNSFTEWSYFLTPKILPHTVTWMFDWYFLLNFFYKRIFLAKDWRATLPVRKRPAFVLMDLLTTSKVNFLSQTFRLLISLLRMPFAVSLIWTFRLKEHPRILMAAVHKDAGRDGWSSPARFQSPPKPSGDVLDRTIKVLWNKLRASRVYI